MRSVSFRLSPRALWPLLGAALLALSSGCRPFYPATPDTFAELPKPGSDFGYRAASADGVVLGVSSYDNTDPHVDLAFVSKAFAQQMREQGYALLEQRDVKTRHGLAGKQFRFGRDEKNNPHLFYVTFYVTDKWVYRLEAGGARDAMLRYEAPIAWHVENFQTRWVMVSSNES